MPFITRVRIPETEALDNDRFFARFATAIAWAQAKWPDGEGFKILLDADLGTAMVFDRHDRVLCTMRQVELHQSASGVE